MDEKFRLHQIVDSFLLNLVISISMIFKDVIDLLEWLLENDGMLLKATACMRHYKRGADISAGVRVHAPAPRYTEQFKACGEVSFVI